MANDAVQTATMKFYESFWQGNAPAQAAVAFSLKELAAGYDKTVTTGMHRLYGAVMADLTKEEIILAFSRASQECKFFPPPSILREFSGRAVDGDPIAREAKDKLLYLLEGMRGPHGPTLKPLLGPVLYGTVDDPRDKDGRCTHAPIRGESTPFPLDRRLKAALERLGWGDSTRGIAVIADHPALRRDDPLAFTDGQYKVNQLRAADEILKRFTDAYREV